MVEALTRGRPLGVRGIAISCAIAAGWLLAQTGGAAAHSPLLSCFDNDDGTVTCEAGYSDGASSAGQTVRVREASNRLILESVFGSDGTFSFKKPDMNFVVEFIGDPSHFVSFDGEDLAK